MFGFSDVISDLGMEIDDSVHACVTKFMINTCNCTTTDDAAKDCLILPVAGAFDPMEILVSGSSAEFYIKPMMSCIGDIDIMHYRNEVIAMPYGQLPPAELLNKYRKIAVNNIVDTHNPGYVYLREAFVYEDGHCVEVNTEHIVEFHPGYIPFGINFNDIVRDYCMPSGKKDVFNKTQARTQGTATFDQHGPALNCSTPMNIDIVSSIRCPIWPPQAADWPTRHRDHGWPDQAAVKLIVNRACDVVQAVHPSCRDDEWERTHQSRLSFSRAEVTLLNSWTPVQQIVYHMLRYVVKHEVFSKTNDNSKTQFSNYHIKTLMLWACEQNPPRSWSVESSLVKICSWMLRKLSDCVEAKHCQHYFISSCNLLDYFDDDSSQMICKRLRSLAYEPVLLSWFVENYIRRSALYCPKDVSMWFVDISSSDKLKKAVNAVVDWKLDRLPRERYAAKYEYEKKILGAAVTLYVCVAYVGINKLTLGLYAPMITNALRQINQRLQGYFIAVMILHVTQMISTHALSQELLEILLTLLAPGAASACNSVTTGVTAGTSTSMRKATQLATLSTVRSNALEMLHDEMAKAYLHQILSCGQDSACCVVRVLLAALYYKSGCFQAAANHCKHAIHQCHCDQRSVFCINAAEQLPRIDQSVDSVAGLITLYQHVHQKALHDTEQSENGNKPAFTSKLLAHYLIYFYTKCSPVRDARSNQMRNYQYELCTSKQPLITDVLLFKTTVIQLDECTGPAVAAAQNNNTDNNESSSTDTSLLATLLELVAMEKLISHRQVMVRELNSDKFPFLNEFEVLHAYKCGLFKECLDMCRNYVNLMLRAGCLRSQYFLIVINTFYGLLDGEILSLFGIMRLTDPIRLRHYFVPIFPKNSFISLLTLSIYLMVQCQKKLRSDSLCDTLQLIRYVHDRVFPGDGKEYFLDRLILKLSYRSLKLCIVDSASNI